MPAMFWDKYAAAGYDALRVLIPYEQLQEELWQAAVLTPQDQLLVAGCGTGNFEWLATRRIPALRVDGVDLSLEMLKRARAKCAGHAGVRHQQADLCAGLPFPTATFDVAVMCNVLYALPDQAGALAEIARVLRPGGRFILCDRHPGSNMSSISRSHLVAARRLPLGAQMARWGRVLAALPAFGGIVAANFALRKFERAGEIQCLKVEDVRSTLAHLGFTVSESRAVYAEQCWLLHAIRQPGEEGAS